MWTSYFPKLLFRSSVTMRTHDCTIGLQVFLSPAPTSVANALSQLLIWVECIYKYLFHNKTIIGTDPYLITYGNTSKIIRTNYYITTYQKDYNQALKKEYSLIA